MEYNSKLACLLLLVICFFLPVAVFAATAPVLGTTSTFGVVSSTYTGNIAATNVAGDVCYTTGPGTFAPTITGGGSLTVTCTNGADQAIALNTLNTQSCTAVAGATLNSIIIGSNSAGTFPPGCYAFSGAINITSGTTVTLDLAASDGDGGNVWVFKSAGALTTGASTAGFPSIHLANGASAANVFWAPTATTLGANFAVSATPTFIGTIIDPAGITLGHFANLLGRVLDFQTTVTADTNIITVPITDVAPVLHLRKIVDNTGGGVASAGAWTIKATGALGLSTNLTGTTPVDSGGTFKADTYTLAETGGPSGYTASIYSCVKNSGAPVVGNSITLANGDVATCTITNTFVPGATETITVIKLVVGGIKGVADFPLFVNGLLVASGDTNSFIAPAIYTVTETPSPNYSASFSGFCPGGVITLAVGTSKVCTITNTYTAPGPSGSGGLLTPIPPLIDLVKVPSPFALPNGPGPVTYTYTLSNIGTVPVTNITLVGDSCSPIGLVSGDTNNNGKLEVNEVWTYNCFTTLSQTHTNTVTATGWANGISAVHIASATVVVGASVVPPLIHVTKVPNVFILSAPGGEVTYTYTVTNPGAVPLNNVSLTDDKCTGLSGYILGNLGDVNKNNLLETNEAWSFICKSNLFKTTTNTATAIGYDPSGLYAKDFAIATVVVNTPTLPSTGFPPKTNNYDFIKNIIKIFSNYY